METKYVACVLMPLVMTWLVLGVVEVVTDSIGVGGTFVKPGQGTVAVECNLSSGQSLLD